MAASTSNPRVNRLLEILATILRREEKKREAHTR